MYVYRTFLNSILLVSGSPGGKLLIVPSFPAAVNAEIQEQAIAAYREAYGSDVEIAAVDAESLAHANGSLRCIACPVPLD